MATVPGDPAGLVERPEPRCPTPPRFVARAITSGSQGDRLEAAAVRPEQHRGDERGTFFMKIHSESAPPQEDSGRACKALPRTGGKSADRMEDPS